MITIAIGGQSFDIQPWVIADYYYTPTLLRSSVFKTDLPALLESLTFRPDRPTVRLIGFSRGAMWALQMYERFPAVREVHAHSPAYVLGSTRLDGKLVFYRTRGDRAGNVYHDTFHLYDRYLMLGHKQTYLYTINPTPIKSKGLVQRYSFWNNHQFHNCVTFLPVENRP